MSFVLTVSFVIYDEKHKMSNTYTFFLLSFSTFNLIPRAPAL